MTKKRTLGLPWVLPLALLALSGAALSAEDGSVMGKVLSHLGRGDFDPGTPTKVGGRRVSGSRDPVRDSSLGSRMGPGNAVSHAPGSPALPM